MHPEQYRNFKSGQAKKNFLADLQKAKDAKMGSQLSTEQLAAFKHAKADAIVCPVKGQLFWEFQGDGEAAPAVEPFIGKEYKEGDAFCYIQAPWGEYVEVKADLGGKLVEINATSGIYSLRTARSLCSVLCAFVMPFPSCTSTASLSSRLPCSTTSASSAATRRRYTAWATSPTSVMDG